MASPEELARHNIDAFLVQCGWVIQNYKQLDLSPARGIAIREVRLKEGRCDYLLLIDRKPIGIIEAKTAGMTLSSVADQSGRYAENLPDFLRGSLSGKLPFLYESTGIETFFRDERDPHPRSRRHFDVALESAYLRAKLETIREMSECYGINDITSDETASAQFAEIATDLKR